MKNNFGFNTNKSLQLNREERRRQERLAKRKNEKGAIGATSIKNGMLQVNKDIVFGLKREKDNIICECEGMVANCESDEHFLKILRDRFYFVYSNAYGLHNEFSATCDYDNMRLVFCFDFEVDDTMFEQMKQCIPLIVLNDIVALEAIMKNFS